MTFQTIKEQWESYLAILPKNAHPIQVQETRRAFYGGCLAMQALYNLCSGDDVTEDAGVELLKAFQQELDAFAIDVKEGRA